MVLFVLGYLFPAWLAFFGVDGVLGEALLRRVVPGCGRGGGHLVSEPVCQAFPNELGQGGFQTLTWRSGGAWNGALRLRLCVALVLRAGLVERFELGQGGFQTRTWWQHYFTILFFAESKQGHLLSF